MNSQGTNAPDSRFTRAAKIFKKHGGILRTSHALEAGIHPATLYAMRDSGEIEVISRGMFRLSDIPPLGNPDLVTVATRVPHGVICLISALSFHELTTPDTPMKFTLRCSEARKNPAWIIRLSELIASPVKPSRQV